MPAQEVLLVTGSYDRDIRFWEAWSGICSRTINRSGDVGQVNRLAISPDQRLLVAAIHKKVNIYEVAVTNDVPLTTLDGHTMNVTAVCFQSEGKWLVTGSEDGTIRIWDLRNASQHRKYVNGSPVNDVCVHPNQGELVSCDQAGRVKLWDLSLTGSNAATELKAAGDVPMRCVSISLLGTSLIAGNLQGQIFVWKINEDTLEGTVPRFQAVDSFKAHSKYLSRAVISPDSKTIATCSADKLVKIWTIFPTCEVQLEKVLEGHQRFVWDAAFSADSAYLVTASSDHSARLWKLATGETVRQYNGHNRGAICCALHDGIN